MKLLDGFRLYGKYAGNSIRGQLQYPASFLLQTFGYMVMTGVEFLAVAALFARFGTLKGWSLGEAAVFYGTISVAFAVCSTVTHGFDAMGPFVKNGELDRILLRPRGTILQILGCEFTLRKFGRLCQGLIVLVYGFLTVPVRFSVAKVLVLAAAFAGGAIVFLTLMIIQAAIAFRTVETLELMNTLTFGGMETAQYPITIYPAFFRKFFTFVVPVTCVSYYPLLFVLGRPDPLGSPVWLQILAPAACVPFFFVGTAIWRSGLKRYASTGS